MNPNDALRQAKALVAVHGLTSWLVKLDNSKARAGLCQHNTRTISLSRPLIALWPESDVLDTVLHEIAHALAGPAIGHGPEWVKIAKSIGCNGERTYKAAEGMSIPYRYTGSCPGCKRVTGRHKLSKAIKLGASCGHCSPKAFNVNYRLVWVDSNGVRV